MADPALLVAGLTIALQHTREELRIAKEKAVGEVWVVTIIDITIQPIGSVDPTKNFVFTDYATAKATALKLLDGIVTAAVRDMPVPRPDWVQQWQVDGLRFSEELARSTIRANLVSSPPDVGWSMFDVLHEIEERWDGGFITLAKTNVRIDELADD